MKNLQEINALAYLKVCDEEKRRFYNIETFC